MTKAERETPCRLSVRKVIAGYYRVFTASGLYLGYAQHMDDGWWRGRILQVTIAPEAGWTTRKAPTLKKLLREFAGHPESGIKPPAALGDPVHHDDIFSRIEASGE